MTKHRLRIKTRNSRHRPEPLMSGRELTKLLLDNLRQKYSLTRSGKGGRGHLYHEGMIDSYMRQLCDAKSDAIAEVIDGQESTFDYSTWRDYRTFALEMLSKEGYEFAVKALRDSDIKTAVAAVTAITAKTA